MVRDGERPQVDHRDHSVADDERTKTLAIERERCGRDIPPWLSTVEKVARVAMKRSPRRAAAEIHETFDRTIACLLQADAVVEAAGADAQEDAVDSARRRREA